MNGNANSGGGHPTMGGSGRIGGGTPAPGVTEIIADEGIVLPSGGTGVVSIKVRAPRLVESDCINGSASTIDNLRIVRVVGDLAVAVAQADTDAHATAVIGVSTESAPAPGDPLLITIAGEATVEVDIPASAVAGDHVWLSPIGAGLVTVTKPASRAVHIGVVKGADTTTLIVDLNIYPDATPGDVTGATATDAGIVLSNAGGPVIGIGQQVAAEWSIANTRVYAVDFVNGNDANAGFTDAAGTSAGQYATACAAAGAVAKKTIAGLAAIFPRVGNGRLVEIVIANGGVNAEQIYTGSPADFLNGSMGWGAACPLVRGTGTNTTAGCTAFDGSTADVDYQGQITVAGLNVAGYNPTGAATTTSLPCTKVGGAAPAFPAEPAAPGGWRIRFDAATATVALRNQCRAITSVATATLTPLTAFSAVPAATDVFYVEQAGYAFGAMSLGGAGLGDVITGCQIASGRSTGAIQLVSTFTRFAGCGCASLSTLAPGLQNGIGQTISHPVLGTRTIGGGLRVEGNFTTTDMGSQSNQALWVAGTATMSRGWSGTTWNVGCFAGVALICRSMSAASETDNTLNPIIGSLAGTTPRTKRLEVRNSTISCGSIVIEGAGASPAITVLGRTTLTFPGVVSGSTGNTDVGMDLTGARGALIVLAATPTVTGTAGDIRLAGGQIISWAQAIATGIVDSAGNRILGTAGTPPLGMDTKTGGIFTSLLGATFSYIADERPIAVYTLAANSIGRVSWATSQRLMTRMRMQLLDAGPSVVAFTATLYKNGVATAMVCTMPAGSAIFTKVVDAAHPIYFADGDDWAIRLDAAQAGGEGSQTLICGVTVEWCA